MLRVPLLLASVAAVLACGLLCATAERVSVTPRVTLDVIDARDTNALTAMKAAEKLPSWQHLLTTVALQCGSTIDSTGNYACAEFSTSCANGREVAESLGLDTLLVVSTTASDLDPTRCGNNVTGSASHIAENVNKLHYEGVYLVVNDVTTTKDTQTINDFLEALRQRGVATIVVAPDAAAQSNPALLELVSASYIHVTILGDVSMEDDFEGKIQALPHRLLSQFCISLLQSPGCKSCNPEEDQRRIDVLFQENIMCLGVTSTATFLTPENHISEFVPFSTQFVDTPRAGGLCNK